MNEPAKTGGSFRALLHDVVVAEREQRWRAEQEQLITKKKMNISQQILALDARYNAYRVQNNPQYRKCNALIFDLSSILL